MPACLQALGNDRLYAMGFQPARLGDSGGAAHHDRARLLDGAKQVVFRQPEVKTDNMRTVAANQRCAGPKLAKGKLGRGTSPSPFAL